MSSESEINDVQSLLDRIINSRNTDLSLFAPFFPGFNPPQTRPDSAQTEPDPDHSSSNPSSPDDDHHHNQRDRIILINPLTQEMVVIEGTGLDTLFRSVPDKDGPPPASKSSIEAMPGVEIREGDDGECVICLEEWVKGGIVKEMPCKHRFHGRCIEKWLGMHGSCPVCRFTMPVEGEEDGGKKGEEREIGGERRRGQREIWVSFSIGSRRTGDVSNSSDSDNQLGSVNWSNLSDSDSQSDSSRDGDRIQVEERGSQREG